LHDPINDTFCCLGVLCKILDVDSDKSTYILNNKETLCTRFKYKGISTIKTLPTSLGDEIGLSFLHCNELASLNDTGYSFEYIAKYIEYNL
jgi:hypothetical protein